MNDESLRSTIRRRPTWRLARIRAVEALNVRNRLVLDREIHDPITVTLEIARIDKLIKQQLDLADWRSWIIDDSGVPPSRT